MDTDRPEAGFGAAHVVAPEGWFAAFIAVDLPVAVDVKPALHRSTQALIELLRTDVASQRTVYLELDSLTTNNAVKQIAANGRLWGPEMGLGVVPGGLSPRFWTSNDFLDRNYDQPIPELMQTVVLLNTDEPGAQHACDAMTGSGGLIQVLHRSPIEHLQNAWHALLQPGITEQGLAAYTVYVPLVSGTSLAKPAEFAHSMEPIDFYMREDVAARGIFVFSRTNLSGALRMAGFHLDHALSDLGRSQKPQSL